MGRGWFCDENLMGKTQVEFVNSVRACFSHLPVWVERRLRSHLPQALVTSARFRGTNVSTFDVRPGPSDQWVG